MNIREAIRQALLSNQALTAIVANRVSSHYAPANTPADKTWIVMSKISGGEEGAHDGNQRLSHPLFQFTIGGGAQEKVDEVQRLLIALNCTEYTYTENGTPYVLTFFHRDDRDAVWDGGSRISEASVDLEIWVNT